MPRRRRHYRRAVAIPRPKYSSETMAFNGTIINPGTTGNVFAELKTVLIPPLAAFGRRKCKYFTLKIFSPETRRTSGGTTMRSGFTDLFFAVVFVPEGTQANSINISTTETLASIYEPNQNVIMSGKFNHAQVYTIRSRLSRLLNSNDSIWLVVKDNMTNGSTSDSIATDVTFTFNYAITF